MEQTLPFDVERCKPNMESVRPDPKCENCMRFFWHPWQTFCTHGQWFFVRVNPEDCTKQIPVSEGGAK